MSYFSENENLSNATKKERKIGELYFNQMLTLFGLAFKYREVGLGGGVALGADSRKPNRDFQLTCEFPGPLVRQT